MFLVIPTGTDAPIYHWPYATVGLIIVNIALLFLVPPESSSPVLDENDEVVENVQEIPNFERYALAIGDGRLHPIQWVTHNFLHFNIIHLAGNMLFLWAFGIVVEGKLGALKYLLLYLAIGTLHGALVQTILVRSGLDQHAAGASAVIYGLLATCMIWAPRNELNCTAVLLVGFRVLVYQWDFYFTTVAILYIGEQVLRLAVIGSLGGKIMISEMGHLSGAFWGTVVALAVLKAGLVDCEGWDLFTLWAKRRKLAEDWRQREKRLDHEKKVLHSTIKARFRARSSSAPADKDPDLGPSQEQRAAATVRRIQSLIEQGDVAGALSAYDKAARAFFNWPSQPDLYAIIKALHARGAEADSIRLMRDHCRNYPGNSTKMHLKLAQILIRDFERPAAALRVLAQVPPGSLPGDLEAVRQKLVKKAGEMREEGVLELEGDD
jgi:membrane associated rhomboid family serine protease